MRIIDTICVEAQLDTEKFAKKLRAIGKHFSALADELEVIDKRRCVCGGLHVPAASGGLWCEECGHLCEGDE